MSDVDLLKALCCKDGCEAEKYSGWCMAQNRGEARRQSLERAGYRIERVTAEADKA